MKENQKLNQIGNEMENTVTIKQSSRILGVPYATAYKWIVLEKKISHINYGKTKVVLLNALLDFKNSHIVEGNN
ncbi:hypothetical protein DBY21_09965 [Candidatus Gastranaerophilales bacterium]|nr:MAG: hypothetical protein DBY21_09965 [Candidatus Gastranaerophilales bacterium]